MKRIFAALSCVLAVSLCHAADITGVWRTVDDKTGFSKALIEIKKQPNGTYAGTIIKVIPRPGYTPKEFCQHCPAPYTNKPILGLTLLTGLRKDPDNSNQYLSGQLIDPLSGKIYRGKGLIKADGKLLNMRAYLGVSALGRTQTWIRER